jgi:TonB family protein
MEKIYQSHVKVRIPEPCHEDWNKMTPKEKGRFCGSCDKIVVDFASMSTVELQQFLGENKNKKMCGHFKKAQLSVPPVEIVASQTSASLSPFRKFAIAAFFIFGLSLFSCTTEDGEKVEELVANNQSEKVDQSLQKLATVFDQLDDSIEVNDIQLQETKTNLQPDQPMPPGMFIRELAPEPPILVDGEMEVEGMMEVPIDGPIDEPKTCSKNTTVVNGVEVEQVEVYDIVETMPEYPGGESELYKYLGKAIYYPKSQEHVSGNVYVSFVIGKDGDVSGAKVLRGLGDEHDRISLEAIRNMPKWIPGKQRGKNVAVRYTIPIRFRIQ